MTLNSLTFDIEDWFQSTFDFDRPISDRVVHNTRAVLEILAAESVRATFFVQGMVTETYPELVRDIYEHGHELGSHAFSHRPLFAMSPAQFKDELDRSVDLIEQCTGEKVRGFRAPDFSISREMPWFWDALEEKGIEYDSSVFPRRMKRYGFDDVADAPFRIEGRRIVELPLSVVNVGRRRIPFGGGGYFRLVPVGMTLACVRRVNKAGRPAMVYLHPYEINPDDFRGESVPWKIRLHQGLFRSRIAGRLRTLCRSVELGTCKEVIGATKAWRTEVF